MVAGPKTTLVLERPTDTSDGKGGYTRTWAPLRNVRGVLTTLSGEKRVIYDKLGVVATHRFICDRQRGIAISEHDRFRLGTAYYQVKMIDDNGIFVDITLESGTGKKQT